MYCGKHCVRVEGGSRGSGENGGGGGWQQRQAAVGDSPSGPWHVEEAGGYEGLKPFC